MFQLPEGWLEYTKGLGKIPGTRFIAFKVPLRKLIYESNQVPADQQFETAKLAKMKRLGLVIDLTNTNRYYDAKEFTDRGIEYIKIPMGGRTVPNVEYSIQFRKAVKAFCAENDDNDKLIGVHCTHGVNRTGFLICRYMIEELGIDPEQAIQDFEGARGHQMDHESYKDALKELKPATRKRRYTGEEPTYQPRDRYQ